MQVVDAEQTLIALLEPLEKESRNRWGGRRPGTGEWGGGGGGEERQGQRDKQRERRREEIDFECRAGPGAKVHRAAVFCDYRNQLIG